MASVALSIPNGSTTLAVGSVVSLAVKVAVPLSSLSVKAVPDNVTPSALSLSILRKLRLSVNPSYPVPVPEMLTSMRYVTLSSRIASSTPATMTVCGVLKFAAVKVKEAGTGIPSLGSELVSLTAIERLSRCAAEPSLTVKVALSLPFSAVMLSGDAAVMTTDTVSLSVFESDTEPRMRLS